MDDLISRQAAIEALQSERQELVVFMDFCLKTEMYATRYTAKMERNRIEADIFILENLPTAEPSVVTMKLEVDKESLKKAMEEAELTREALSASAQYLLGQGVYYAFECGGKKYMMTVKEESDG